MKAGIAKTAHTPLARAELPVDTAALARFLIGKLLVRELPEGVASGRIVETEAYVIGDAAGHAYGGMTPRNRALFLERGHAYVYLAYGVSWMLNVSSEAKGVGAGVLIRALEPLEGIAIMANNRGTERLRDLARGPGRLAQALRIDRSLDGLDLCQERPSMARARRPRRERDRQGENRREREDRHYTRGRPRVAVLPAGEPVRERRQVAQRMRGPHPCSSSVSGQSGLSTPFSKECNILQKFRIHGMTIAIGRRKLGGGARLLVATERRLYTTGDEGTGNFLFESSVTH